MHFHCRPQSSVAIKTAPVILGLVLSFNAVLMMTHSQIRADESPPKAGESKDAPVPNPPEAAEKPIVVPPKKPVAGATPSDRVSKREDSLLTDEIELQRLLRTLGPEHPKVQDVKGRIKVTKAWLAEQGRNSNKSLVVEIPGRDPKETAKVLTDLYGDKTKITIDESTGIVLIVITQTKSATETQALLNEIRSTANQLKPPSSVSIPSQMGLSAFPADEIDLAMDRESRQLALRIQTATADEQPKLRKELEAITEKQFDHREERRKQELESLAQRIHRLKALHAHRQTHKADVIERRVKELLDPDANLKWDPVDNAEEKKVATRDSKPREGEIAIATDHAVQQEGLANVPRAADAKAIEPTYNGVTISEWLRVLEIERNPNKILDAIHAMQYLVDEAEPRKLARATFHTMSLYGALDYSNPVWQVRMNIINQSKTLLFHLPEKVVIDEAFVELTETGTKKATQAFFLDFLSSTHNMRIPFRDEVRRRSRGLIGLIVGIARQDDNANLWAIWCAKPIVAISDQPITTYPDLVPLVEENFLPTREKKRLGNLPVTTLNLSQEFPIAAVLLGQSGLRVADVLAFAEERIQEEPKAVTQPFLAMGANGPQTEFDKGIECLIAVAPHSSESVKRLIKLLREKWEMATVDRDNDGRVNRNAIGLQQCFTLVGALGRIGFPAKNAIPDLNRIMQSPISAQFSQNLPGGSSTLNVCSQLAIKQIEDAKPKPEPEPLPE